MIVAGLAVFIMLSGIGVVSFAWYSTNVVLPQDTRPPLATTIFASDGKTAIAKVGNQNRTFVTINDIPLHVQHAVAAAEDRNFYRHSGVDYKGIARAAWNNFTGGDRQGASTITQQYARNAYDNLKDDTYTRKIKEAILASKLNDRYSKEEIMQHYLNVIYFGRGAYGIEAAAQTYYGKPAKKLTVAEGAVLAALIKQPVPSKTHKGYDPAVNPEPAKERWNYVLDGMVAENWLDPAQRATLKYPMPRDPKKSGPGLDFGVNTPYGNVINYVKQEMADKGLCTENQAEATDEKPTCSNALRDGGYRITTTIDKKMQAAAVAAAQRKSRGSELSDQPKNLMAALVAIDPRNGHVVAYYGGDNGTGTDYAGKNTNPDGTYYGGHPPGSSFKVYTLAAALANGISTESRWKAKNYKPEGVEYTVVNADRESICGDHCTLEQATLESYNVPFYYVTEKIGRDKVIDMARRAGISAMWGTNPAKLHDMNRENMDQLESAFYNPVAYGQYPITVLDHANGLATFANGGKYIKAHFVVKVEQQDDAGKWQVKMSEQIKPRQTIDPNVVADVDSVLLKYPEHVHHVLDDGRKSTGKTGTWELNEKSKENGHAWMVGYTPQLATAVWVGNTDSKVTKVRLRDGRKIGGANLPADIWKRFMDDALRGKDKLDFPPAAHIGDPNAGNGEQPPPPPTEPQTPDCTNPFDLFCNGGGTGNGNGGGPGRPGNGGGGGGLPPEPLATTTRQY